MPTPASPPPLSPAEWQVMKVLWDHGPAAARDVHAALPKQDWSDRTVKTLLARLVAKAAVTYETVGNSYRYTAAIERTEATRDEVRTLLRRVADGTLSPLLAAFVDEAELGTDELDQLQALIDAKRSTPAKSRPRSPKSKRATKPKKGGRS